MILKNKNLGYNIFIYIDVWVNGEYIGYLDMKMDSSKEDIERAALEDGTIKGPFAKVIVVPNKLINFITKE